MIDRIGHSYEVVKESEGTTFRRAYTPYLLTKTKKQLNPAVESPIQKETFIHVPIQQEIIKGIKRFLNQDDFDGKDLIYLFYLAPLPIVQRVWNKFILDRDYEPSYDSRENKLLQILRSEVLSQALQDQIEELGLENAWANALDLTQYHKLFFNQMMNSHVSPNEIKRYTSKYTTWGDLCESVRYSDGFRQSTKDKDTVRILFPGSFDEPTANHAIVINNIHNNPSRVADVNGYHSFEETIRDKYIEFIVGIEPDWLLRERKGAERPRYPIEHRILTLGQLKNVSKVVVLPLQSFDNAEDTNKEFLDIYETLDIDFLLCGFDNRLLDVFGRRMNMYNWRMHDRYNIDKGALLVDRHAVFTSSTLAMDTLRDNPYARKYGLSPDIVRRFAEERAAIARQFGVLRDYPNGTNEPVTWHV